MEMKIQKKISFMMRNINGFSFVELMTVIAIIGLMAGIALPSYISGMPDRRLQAAARDLYGAMQRTRLLAVRENRNRILFFESNGGNDSYYIDAVKKINLAERDARFGQGMAPEPDKDKYRIKNGTPTAMPFSITFTPAGTVDSPVANTIYIENISNPSKSFAVIVQESGAIKTIRFDGTQWN
jgi:prepilin-type N-terminal cleavage/methylation domain-containing protein